MPRRATPQASFTKVHQEGNSVGKIGFHFERHRPAIDEGILARKTRTIEQHLVAPIYRFISGKCITADIDKEDLSRIGEEVVIEPTLRRELCRRYAILLIGAVSLQVFAAKHPLVATFGIGRERSSEIIPGFSTARVRVESIGHARLQLNALHLGKASLRVSPPHTEDERRYKND